MDKYLIINYDLLEKYLIDHIEGLQGQQKSQAGGCNTKA